MRNRHKRSDRFSRILILAGIILIAVTLIWEAYRYPWATVFGGAPQNDSALPDPPPIVWANGDHEAGLSSISPTSVPAILPGRDEATDEAPAQYADLGVIKIPKLNLSQHILEGTEKQLHYGVGHVTGTSSIGGKGNCAIAGHNTTSFRYLNKLNAGDRIILKIDKNIFTYSVFKSFTVLPTDTYVLNNINGESATLTMITCTPYLTGTHRFIVQARLIEEVSPELGTGSKGSGYINSIT